MTLFGNRVFADVINLTIFEFRVSPELNNWYPCKSKEGNLVQRYMGDVHVRTQAATTSWRDAATSSGPPRTMQAAATGP